MTPLLLAALGVGMGIAVGVAAGRGWALADLDLAEVRRLQAAEAGSRSADEAWRHAAGVDAELCRVRALLQAAEEDLAEANRREMDAELADLGAAFVEAFAAAGSDVAEDEEETEAVDVSLDELSNYRREIAASLPDGWAGPDALLRRGMAHVSIGMEMMAHGGATISTLEDWGEEMVDAALAARERLEKRLAAGEQVPGVMVAGDAGDAEAGGATYAPDEEAVEAELVEVRGEMDGGEEYDAELEQAWLEAGAAWLPLKRVRR